MLILYIKIGIYLLTSIYFLITPSELITPSPDKFVIDLRVLKFLSNSLKE